MDEAMTCRVRLGADLGSEWAHWFVGFSVTPRSDGTTELVGSVCDQAALHGLLALLRDLAIPLVSVEVTGPPTSSVEPARGNEED